MPDIAMCQQRECPLKASCYRYRAVPSEWQSYMERDPKTCKDYWPIEDRPTRTMEEIENE